MSNHIPYENTINACESLYGSFYHNFIEVKEKNVEDVRTEILEYLGNSDINIDLYIYIMKSRFGTIIKALR